MNVTKSKYGIIAALLLVTACLTTCQFCDSPAEKHLSLQDTTILNTWQDEKQALILGYEARLQQLAQRQDSIQQDVKSKKDQIRASRAKTKVLEAQLQNLLNDADTNGIAAESIRPIVDSLSEASEDNARLCDETISVLECQVASKDSSIALQSDINLALKSMCVAKDLKIGMLRQEVTQMKAQERRLNRRQKLTSGCLLVLTGIAGSLVLSQAVR